MFQKKHQRAANTTHQLREHKASSCFKKTTTKKKLYKKPGILRLENFKYCKSKNRDSIQSLHREKTYGEKSTSVKVLLTDDLKWAKVKLLFPLVLYAFPCLTMCVGCFCEESEPAETKGSDLPALTLSITTLLLHFLQLVLSGSHVGVGMSAGHKDRSVHGGTERTVDRQDWGDTQQQTQEINAAPSSCVLWALKL